jgi:prolyl 4-hydroxylase
VRFPAVISSSSYHFSVRPSWSKMLSLGSIIQYFFLAAIAYVLAGAPLLSLLSPPSSSVASKKGNVVDVRTLDSLVIPEKNLSCGAHAYKGVYVLSREPLVVYIEGFLGERESEEVLRIRYVWRRVSWICFL